MQMRFVDLKITEAYDNENNAYVEVMIIIHSNIENDRLPLEYPRGPR